MALSRELNEESPCSFRAGSEVKEYTREQEVHTHRPRGGQSMVCWSTRVAWREVRKRSRPENEGL